ncbi:MAG: hypothetical protein HYT39_01015 [Candidatus Sungbacteria bacterium]|nr:hypothetical protein [Candidatus Sungbacteria bacterium]
MYARNTKSVKVEPLMLESYLAFARGSAGSRIFRQYFAKVNGKKTDVTRAGLLSCAIHISGILKMFSLIGEMQLTVHRTLDAMEKAGWHRTKNLRPGCVIVWAEENADPKRMKKDSKLYSSRVKHSGIYLGNHEAVSNVRAKRAPAVHHWTFGVKNGKPVRKIIATYWHKKLGK